MEQNKDLSHFEPEEKKELARQYELLKHGYEQLCKEICDVINHLSSATAVTKLAHITYRVKTTESFLEKLDRKLYKSPFEEMDDFAGVRVVLYRASDIPKLEAQISEEFKLHNTDNKTATLGTSMMGYGGTHMVISLGGKYGGARHKAINKLKCEVQLRTVLQDAWSSISHSLVYKTSHAMPSRMLRDFNNLSALLEVADTSFDRICFDKEALLQKTKEESFSDNFLDLELTHERLIAYALRRFNNLEINMYWQEKLYSDLLQIKEFKTIKDIDVAVRRACAFVAAYSELSPDLFKYSTDYLTKSIGFVSHNFRNVHPFGMATREAFKQFRHLEMP